jgi:hypothetical protein
VTSSRLIVVASPVTFSSVFCKSFHCELDDCTYAVAGQSFLQKILGRQTLCIRLEQGLALITGRRRVIAQLAQTLCREEPPSEPLPEYQDPPEY